MLGHARSSGLFDPVPLSLSLLIRGLPPVATDEIYEDNNFGSKLSPRKT